MGIPTRYGIVVLVAFQQSIGFISYKRIVALAAVNSHSTVTVAFNDDCIVAAERVNRIINQIIEHGVIDGMFVVVRAKIFSGT